MSEGGQETPIRQAMALLQDRKAPDEILAVLEAVVEGDPDFGEAQHLRGVCAVRVGDAPRAVDLYIDAIRRGAWTAEVCVNLALATADAGYPAAGLDTLTTMLRRVPADRFQEFCARIFRALNVADKSPNPHKPAVFRQMVLPLIEAHLAERRFDDALWLEAIASEWWAKSIETEENFAAVMGAMEPLMTKAGHAERDRLPPLAPPPAGAPLRIGFFIHSASMLAHIEVLLAAFKGYRLLGDAPFEPVIYCFTRRNAEMEAAFAERGVRVVSLSECSPETADSSWARLLYLRDRLAADGVQQIVWISLVTLMPLAFAIRLAPVQTWWAMKWRNYDQPDIDGYVSGSALSRYGTLAGRRFRMTQLGVDDWYDPSLTARAAEIRARFAGQTILMTLARAEKMADPAYLDAMRRILTDNPETVFLWAGKESPPEIMRAFEQAGVADRVHFIGWVNTRLYAQVADIFLDTFPFPCAFTLFQAMAAGAAAVVYDSPEAAQTGLMCFIKPMTDGDEGSPEERAEIRQLIGDEQQPLIGIARDPDGYVRLANRLIRDASARAAAGAAAKAFIARYFSDPSAMGRSMADHLVELMAPKL